MTATLDTLRAAFRDVLDDDRAAALARLACDAIATSAGGDWRVVRVDEHGYDVGVRPAPAPEHETAREAAAFALNGALDCTRVWEAWGYGTMGPDDFIELGDQPERLEEVVTAVAAALARESSGNLPTGLITDGPADETGHVPKVAVCTDHQPKQHRDGKPPWCQACGRTAGGVHHDDLGILGRAR